MKIVFMGTPDFAVPSLDILVENGFIPDLVVTQPDRPVGRKRIVTPPPVKQFALSHNIQVIQPTKMTDPNLLELIFVKKPDLIVVVAFGQMLPKMLLELPTIGCINVHASLLPKYRGAAPIQWALIRGDGTTGVTTMWMDEGLDTGDIFLQDSVAIGRDWYSKDLFEVTSVLGSKTLLKTLNHIKNDKIIRRPQNEKESSYAPMLKKNDGLLYWNKGAREIENKIRGLYSWPGAYTFRNEKEIKIWRAKEYSHSKEIYAPGTFAGVVRSEGFLVATAQNYLLVEELQEVGKGRMKALDYLTGHPMSEGDGFVDVDYC